MKKDPWYVKFYDKPLWMHFIVWFTISSIMFFLMFSWESILSFKRLMIGCLSIGCLFGLGFSAMIGLSKTTQKIYDQFSKFENQAKLATDRDQLLKIRTELIEYYRKNVSFKQQGYEARKIVTLIDTRLNYEFKQ